MVTPINFSGKEATLSVNRDITERKKAEDMEDFLHSLLRHDLRNKIQIIQGYLELLEDSELSNKQKRFLDKSLTGTEESIDLIEKVRTLRNLEGEKKLHLESLTRS